MAFDLQNFLSPNCLHICKLVDLCKKIQHKKITPIWHHMWKIWILKEIENENEH